MDLSKIYTVLFEEGSAGTFLIWFVSQHRDFFKLNHTYLNQYTDTSNNKTIEIQNKTQRHLVLGIGSFEYSKQSLDQYLTRHFASVEPNKKIIFKILPHAYFLVTPHKDHLPSINVIMLTYENYDWINFRLEAFERQSSIVNQSRQERAVQNQKHLQQCFKNKNINYCTISIDKILNLDTSEYHKLLEFINSSPIDNWQGIVIDYKNKAGIQEVT